jgi:hypothetical protein
MDTNKPPTSQSPTGAVHDGRGAFVVIGGSPYVAYAAHGGPAYLTRATHDPDGSITLHPVGAPHARLDLAADAGRWYAEREAYAATATHECVRCGTPLTQVDGAWVSVDYLTTAGGLSYCPPGPDTPNPGTHRPRKRTHR